MSYYSKKVKEIKEQVDKNTYPPKFKKEKNFLCHRNCYAYVLNTTVSDAREEIFFPGCISNEREKKDIFSSYELKERLRKDLQFLGFTYRSDDGKLSDGEYRIAVYVIPTYHDMPIGFHISRQDETGEWSEKPSWKAGIRKIGKKADTPPDISKEGPRLVEVLILKKKE